MARGRPTRATVYARLDRSITELRERLGGLPSAAEARAVWDDIWHLEAHHSTALEGNTLVLREVEQLLEQQRPVGRKPLKDYLEVQGYGEAARWVYAQALEPSHAGPDDLLTIMELRHIHHLAMGPVWTVAPHEHAGADEGPGDFRRHDIQPFGSGMTPPAWPTVDAEVRAWVTSACSLADGGDVPWPERVARVHASFERVHPFIDGNGRTGRLALNLLLVRLGYPPAIVLKQQRPTYLASLAKADQGDDGPLGEIVARAITDNLHRFIIPSVAGPARLVPLQALVTSDVSLAALRHAARRGRLDAYQEVDGTWRSSRHAVDEYLHSRHARSTARTTS
ncbi:Fic family protein [Pseudokineococcus sp. 1T1Z-3]|uniref:Fic family protein n=1 Tax=Pseudokineococcus sp. 1T1Z-3 TaxID=3132745 RepID=UPI0030A04464